MSDTILDRQWYDCSGNPILDVGAVVEKLVVSTEEMVYIGTDAQRIGRGVDFVTVVIIHKERKGGRIFYCKTRAPRNDMSLWEKLSLETWYSLEVAMALEPFILFGKAQMEVHADANPDERYDSHDYVKQIAGMIMGQGFSYVLKPNAWASSHAADRLVKNKHLSTKKRRQYRRTLRKNACTKK